MSQINYAGLLIRLKDKRNLEKMRSRQGFLTPDEKNRLKNIDAWIDRFLDENKESKQLKLEGI